MNKQEFLYPLNNAIKHIDLLFKKIGNQYDFYLVEKAFELRLPNESSDEFNARTSFAQSRNTTSALDKLRATSTAIRNADKYGIKELLALLRSANRFKSYASNEFAYIGNTGQAQRAATLLREGSKIIVDVMLQKERMQESSIYQAEIAVSDMRSAFEIIKSAVVEENRLKKSEQEQQRILDEQRKQAAPILTQPQEEQVIPETQVQEQEEETNILTIAMASTIAFVLVAFAIKKKRK